jgi:hypothetical protein
MSAQGGKMNTRTNRTRIAAALAAAALVALAIGCSGGKVPETVDESSRAAVAALDDAEVAIFYFQVPDSAEAALLEVPGVQKLARVGESLVVEAPAGAFRTAARETGVKRCGYFTSADGVSRMDNRLRLQIMRGLETTDPGSIQAIASCAAEPTQDDQDAMAAMGITVHSVVGRTVTLEGTPAALGRLAASESVTRLEAQTMLSPMK